MSCTAGTIAKHPCTVVSRPHARCCPQRTYVAVVPEATHGRAARFCRSLRNTGQSFLRVCLTAPPQTYPRPEQTHSHKAGAGAGAGTHMCAQHVLGAEFATPTLCASLRNQQRLFNRANIKEPRHPHAVRTDPLSFRPHARWSARPHQRAAPKTQSAACLGTARPSQRRRRPASCSGTSGRGNNAADFFRRA